MFDPVEACRRMYLIRATEEAICERYAEGKMRLPIHISIGQEAAAVGAMMALEEGDHVFGSHRSHHPYLAKGGSVDALIAELYGKASGCTGGWGGSMYLQDPSCGFMGSFAIVGDCISVATGAALAFQLEESPQVAVAYFGDGAIETGQFWESLNFAATRRLPILYICENNGYATQTPIWQRQPDTPMCQRVGGFFGSGMDFGERSMSVSDANVAEVFNVVEYLRKEPPGFIEIETYRYREHVGPNYDWDMGYRSRAEVEDAMARDPVSGFGLYAQRRSIKEQVQKAFDAAEAAPWPEADW